MILVRNVPSHHLESVYWTRRLGVLFAVFMIVAICVPAFAQRSTATKPAEDAFEQWNTSVEELVKKVWPSVVQIQVTSYGPREESERGNTTVTVGRQRSVGSGFVIDADG